MPHILFFILSLTACMTNSYFYDIDKKFIRENEKFIRENDSSDYRAIQIIKKNKIGRQKDKYFILSKELSYPSDTNIFVNSVKNIIEADLNAINEGDYENITTYYNNKDVGIPEPFKDSWIVIGVVKVKGIKYSFSGAMYPRLSKKLLVCSHRKYYARDSGF